MKIAIAFALFAAALGFAEAAVAEDAFPSRAIRLVVPYPAGGGTDTIARLVAEKLGDHLKQPIIVDNRPGAGGAIGTGMVADAVPDGYTLLFANSGSLEVLPVMNKAARYDPVNGFAPIAVAVLQPMILVTAKGSPYRTLSDLIAAGRDPKGKLSYSTAGIGSVSHLAGAMFNSAAKTQYLHVPYKGGPSALVGIMGDGLTMYFSAPTDSLSQLRQGKIVAIAVTSRERLAAIPDVPTLAEAGLPGVVVETWYGLLAPGRTPQSVLDRLEREVQSILAEPQMKQRLEVFGTLAAPGRAAEFSALIQANIPVYKAAIEAAGILPE